MGTKVDLTQNYVTFGDPEDAKLLNALGVLSIRHSQLDHVLRMTIKTIENLSIDVALDATKKQGSAEIRKRIEKLALQKIGDGQAFIKLQALLTRAQRASEKRNEAIHNLWGVDSEGTPVVRKDDHSWEYAPTDDDISKISNEINEVTKEINYARLDGFLLEALLKKKPL